MIKFATYTANATMEGAMVIILVCLLISCFFQKQKLATTRTLMALTVVNIALLICQIVQWVAMRQGYIRPFANETTLKRITYSMDYALYYAVAFFFFRYINVYIGELYEEKGVKKEYPVKWQKILILWGIVISVLFAVLMQTERFYYINELGNEWFSLDLYLIMYIFGTACVISSTVTLIRNYNLLKSRGFAVLLLYIVMPNVLAIVDLLNNLCISYMMMSIFIIILYLEIDLRRGNMLLEHQARNTELHTEIMLSQIQPHFLYNTLTTISSLCYMGNSRQAKEVVDRLSDYLRSNLGNMGKNKLIHFSEELEHIKTYLWIEQVRFGNKLAVQYDIGPSEFLLPPLTLQPLVENAVKHGIHKKIQGGTVKISTAETDSEYLVFIEDDGAGFDVNQTIDDGRTHVGIANITQRLDIICGGRCEFDSEKGRGTNVTVHLPKEKKR